MSIFAYTNNTLFENALSGAKILNTVTWIGGEKCR